MKKSDKRDTATRRMVQPKALTKKTGLFEVEFCRLVLDWVAYMGIVTCTSSLCRTKEGT